MNWTKAKCLDQTEVMFAEDPTEAKKLCAHCPLRTKCLGVALDNDISYGVWGATDFEERTRLCPVCRKEKDPSALGCNALHGLVRLARLVELQESGDTTISVTYRSVASAATSAGCLQYRGRSHSTPKAYRDGCRCQAAREALYTERLKYRKTVPVHDGRSRLERFMDLVEIEDGHWMWTGSTNGSGYGNFWNGTRTVRAHLFALKAFPPAEFVECAERRCINPSHRRPAKAA